MESLTEIKIQEVVEESCRITQDRWCSLTKSEPDLLFHRISKKDDWDLMLPLINSNGDSSNFHLTTAEITSSQTLNEVRGFFVTTKDSVCVGVCIFFLSYSTWDGRVIFLDRLEVCIPQHHSLSHSVSESLLSLSLRYTVADIGLKLDCSRFVWQHSADTTPIYPNVQPATLHGWLTLHMDRDAMIRLASTTLQSQLSSETSSVESMIQNCLEELGALDSPYSKTFRLRLATEQDLPVIERLVRGLAIFEREPEAVQVTQDHYRRDGFPPTGEEARPLFFCLLLEDANGYVFGMAFVYVAHSVSFGGRFLYLEDLFIEEEYRGQGGGKAAMEALARICLALDCKKFVWQALDWNTPALNFYAKIGGVVQAGLLTSRFSTSLKEFCMQRPLDC